MQDEAEDAVASVAHDMAAAESGNLWRRPGFLIRRLHQIHLAFFYEECAGFDITPVQSSILTVIGQRPGLEQMRVCEAIGIDRATVTPVIARLERRGLIVRRAGVEDRRLKLLTLTPAGAQLLADIAAHTMRAHARLVAALPPDEREAFLNTMVRLVDANNDHGRAKLRLE